mgnify:CR=1 FL=1
MLPRGPQGHVNIVGESLNRRFLKQQGQRDGELKPELDTRDEFRGQQGVATGIIGMLTENLDLGRGISESRIKSVDNTHVSFTYRKVHSNRVRTMRLPLFAFIHRFLQHVLPTGFMKVRYFGFLSPSFKMPFEQIKARVELAQGFDLKPLAKIEVKAPQPLCCPRCGGRLTYRRTLLPYGKASARIPRLAARALCATTMQPLNSGP